MNIQVTQTKPDDALWPQVADLFPTAVHWLNDPKEHGNYHFFAATDDALLFLGGSVIDIGSMKFGPLSETVIGFLEDLQVLEAHRRKGVGSALLLAMLNHAWQSGCHNVRWTVGYQNEAAIALYQKLGFGFVPDEVPGVQPPETQYTVIAVNPERAQAGYARQ